MKSAVLFIIFNRPDVTKEVFDSIRRAKPPRLYIAADGPRFGVYGDDHACKKVRDIAVEVDWECQLFTLFRNENLGCKKAVHSAIDWFFESEEEGIILEDDCVPSDSFFIFCDSLLNKYRNNNKISFIGGTNFFGEKIVSGEYFYSVFGSIWGWATWKRSWANLDEKKFNIESIKIDHFINKYKLLTRIYLKLCYLLTMRQVINTWDHQWNLACIQNNQLAIVPKANLVSNIGVSGAHTKKRDRRNNLKYGVLESLPIDDINGQIENNSDYETQVCRKLLIPIIVKGYISYFINRIKSNFINIK